MNKIDLKSIPPRTVVYLVLCFLVIGTFISLVLCPSYKSLGKLDREIARVEERIQIQKTLLPLYINLVKKAEAKVPQQFVIPEAKMIPEKNVDLIPSIFKGVARKANVEIVLVNPDFTTLAKRQGAILINAVVLGDFFRLRTFLIEIGKVSYLERVESIEIQERAKNKELKMKLWLRVG